jgi:quercetin dioxygenase-like cupin family protein
MKLTHWALFLGSVTAAAGQTASKAIVINLDSANWTHEKGAAPDSSGVLVHKDETSDGMDLLVRFPAGHVIPAHFHESNERIFVAEGQLTLRQDDGEKLIKAGGFAYLPAQEVQRLSCSSATRCTFYLSWDGKAQSHPAK